MTSPARLTEDAFRLEPLLSLLRRICETPAPTFEEAARGNLVTDLLSEAGLEPHRDAVGNVVASVPGGQGPRVLVAAHLDTVFPKDTDVTVKQVNGRLLAPGIGDNSASLAVLIYYLRRLQIPGPTSSNRPQLTVAATVGEEGLGDLRGIRELMRTHSKDFDAVVALDGHLGTVINQAVGSKRFEVTFKAAGGHSWGDYPNPSAVHTLGNAIHALTQMNVPKDPRSSLNVGEVGGGTSVNAIAQEAFFNLDLRSLDAGVLRSLETEAIKQIKRTAKRHAVKVEIKQVGDRPTAESANRALVTKAKAALQRVDILVRTAASSTDANAAMAAGLPAISFGVYRGGDAHRLSEWLEPASLQVGYDALVQLMHNLSQID